MTIENNVINKKGVRDPPSQLLGRDNDKDTEKVEKIIVQVVM